MNRPAPFTILLVCTGNICRSAMAERLGRAYLDQVMGETAEQVQIHSAGIRAVVDSAMHPHSALVLAGLGGDAGDFRARQFAEGMATGADLVLTMTRAHREEVLRHAPRTLARTFTLREAADLLTRLEGAAVEGAGVPERARQLVQALAAARSHRQAGGDDDIRDPIGHGPEVHEEVGETITAALLPLLQRIATVGSR